MVPGAYPVPEAELRRLTPRRRGIYVRLTSASPKTPRNQTEDIEFMARFPSGVNSPRPAGRDTGRKEVLYRASTEMNTHTTADCSSSRGGPLLCETSKRGLLMMWTAIPASTLARQQRGAAGAARITNCADN